MRLNPQKKRCSTHVAERLEQRALLSGTLSFSNQTISFSGADGIDNNVIITTGPGAGNYTIEDLADTISLGSGMNMTDWTLSPSGHSASGSETGIAGIEINSGDGDDAISVQSTDLPVNIEPGGGTAQVQIGGLGAPFGAEAIAKTVNVDMEYERSGSLLVDDAGDSLHRDVTLNDAEIGGLTPGLIVFQTNNLSQTPSPYPVEPGIITLDGSDGGDATIVDQEALFFGGVQITLNAHGNDVVSVQALAPESTVSVDERAGGATDTVDIGAAGSVANVFGNVSINGDQGTSAIGINDSADTSSLNAAFSIADDGTGAISAAPNINVGFQLATLNSLQLMCGSGANSLTYDLHGNTADGFTSELDTGSGNDITTVISNPAISGNVTDNLHIEGDGGNDIVNIGQGDASKPALAIQGAISITNSDGSDAVTVNGAGITSQRTITVSDSSITGLTPASISLANESSLNVIGGSGADQFSVTPSAAIPIDIDGGDFAPQAAPSDSLHVDVSAATTPVLIIQSTATGNDGRFQFGNFKDVGFTRLADVTPALATILGTVYNAQSGAPIPNLVLFLDENQNGSEDAGEPTVSTGMLGQYIFTSLGAGNHSILLAPSAFSASGASSSVTLAAGQVAAGVNIAAVPVAVAGGPDLTGVLSGGLPTSVIGGKEGKLKLRLTNAGPSIASGNVQIDLFASTDNAIDFTDTQIAAISSGKLHLKTRASKSVKLTFTYPTSLAAGNYFILAGLDATNLIAESNETNNVAASSKAVGITPASIDLTGAFGHLPKSLKAGAATSLPIVIQNLGNVPAKGTIAVDLFASADQALDNSDTKLVGSIPVKINIKNGKSHATAIHIQKGGITAGQFYLIAALNTGQNPAESSYANNDIVSSAIVAVA